MTLQSSDRPDQPSDNPDLGELERLARRFLMLLLHTGMPCTVVTAYPSTPKMPVTVDALPCFMDEWYGDAGELIPKNRPIVRACPVMTWNTGGFAMRVLPRAGDFGYLHVSERSLEKWYAGGGVPMVPPFDHLFSMSDCMFYPGGRPAPAALLHTANLALGTDTGAAPGAELGEIVITPAGGVTVRSATTIVVDAPVVQLGVAAVEHLALAESLHAYLLAMITAAGVVPADGGAAFKAALLAYLGANPPAGFATTKGLGE